MSSTSSMQATKSASSAGGMHQYSFRCGCRSLRFRMRLTVERLMGSSSKTAISSARSVTVPLPYPSGAWEQAFAMSFASTSPVASKEAVSELGFLLGVRAALRLSVQ